MAKINENFKLLQTNYLFSDIGKKVRAYEASKKGRSDIIKLGIGDVTLPLPLAVVDAMKTAVLEQSDAASFRGYPPEKGYSFLREAISANDYAGLGISADEIFVSDGSKCDIANIQELFSLDSVVAISNPIYPVYLDSNIMAGRHNILLMPATAENEFLPELPNVSADIVYLCSPNNPTGTAMDRQTLQKWVDWARTNNVVILFDGAYFSYITSPDTPRSIYEIEGAKEVAVEFRSFSKTAGFTGMRCAYTVIPKEINIDGVSLHAMWDRRQSTKFNGVSYVTQRGAEAVFSESGKSGVRDAVSYYLDNAKTIRHGLESAGFKVFGGVDSPYIWWQLPKREKSFGFFEKLLNVCEVVGTPGVGFGKCGEGYFRLTAFNTKERTADAVERIVKNKERLF